jgi:hypothetical protein
MDTDSKRLHGGTDFIRDRRVQFPGTDCWKNGIFREGTIEMDPKDLHILADMLKPCRTLETMATRDMGFCCHTVPLFEVCHILPNLDDLSSIFMAKEKGEFDP